MATNVVMVQNQPPPVLAVVNGPSNDWATGICDCCSDMDICCFACWCFPCFICRTMREFSEPCAPPCCCDGGPIPPISLAVRYAVRRQYGIQGSLCDDCMCVYCGVMNCCSWCQVAREIRIRNRVVTIISPQPTVVQNQVIVNH